MAVQTGYNINPERGFPGDVALPESPHALVSGIALVNADYTRKPQPGDAMIYVRANNAWATARAADVNLVRGVLSYRADTVQDDNEDVEFDNGDELEIAVLGGYWVNVSAEVRYGDRLQWDAAANQFVAGAFPTLDSATAGSPTDAEINAVLQALGRVPIASASRQPVGQGGYAIARIGY